MTPEQFIDRLEKRINVVWDKRGIDLESFVKGVAYNTHFDLYEEAEFVRFKELGWDATGDEICRIGFPDFKVRIKKNFDEGKIDISIE